MPKLTIIVGMAGSGKTSLGNEIANQSTPRAFIFPDATLINNDNRRRAGYKCLGEMVARLLGRSEDCVMDESHLTDPNFRRIFKQFCDEFLVGIEQDWIFFEADVVACINNLYHDAQEQGRDELSRYKALNKQRGNYQKVPDESEFPGRTVRPVFQCDNPEFSNESEAIKWLESEIARRSRS